MSPQSIKEELDQEIFGQEQSKETLSFAFYLHLMRNQRKPEEADKHPLPKSHILVLGSSGSGKRLMIATLVKKHDIPFIKIDCTLFLSGQNFHEIINAHLRYLVLQVGVEQAAKAIIIFEDFDKIANRQIGNNVSFELQDEMLGLIEQQERMVQIEQNKAPILFPVNNLMYVFSGRFAGIEQLVYMRSRVSNHQDEIIKKKEERMALVEKYRAMKALEITDVNKRPERIGFKTSNDIDTISLNEKDQVKNAIESLYNELKEDELEHLIDAAFQKELLSEMDEDLQGKSNIITQVQYQDLVNYGVLSELAGRIGFIAPFERLTEAEIIQILKRPNNNIIDLYKNYFSLHNDTLEIKDEVYILLAKEIGHRNIGTRSINTIIVQLLRELLYKAPNKVNEKFVIDEAYFKKKIFS